jgi:hypothetical protein
VIGGNDAAVSSGAVAASESVDACVSDMLSSALVSCDSPNAACGPPS